MVDIPPRKQSVTLKKAAIAHEHWDNPIEFLMTCIGFAVGLGNVWRFPYLCFQNGGSAFVIAFFILLIFMGLPLFFLELTVAQFSKLGILKIWQKLSPAFSGLGLSAVITCGLVCIYYNVIIAYCMIYFVSSFVPKLPWKDCSHWWNDELCFIGETESLNTSIALNVTSNLTTLSTAIPGAESAATQYFYNFVLEMSTGIEDPIGMNWKLSIALFVSWMLTFLVLCKGIQSLGKVSYVTAIFPYIMIFALTVRGFTLPGSTLGLKYYIGSLNWIKLFTLKTWIDAASQVCFCLSLAQGGLITLGKHNKFHYNHMRTAVFVALLDGFTGLFAGLAIFSVLGFMSHRTGIEVSELAVGGPGLSFIVYPEALSMMPFPWIWCILFFLMMILIGFGSLLSLAETVLDSCIMYFKIKKRKNRLLFRFLGCLAMFIIGLSMTTKGGYYLLVIIENYTCTVPLLAMVTLEGLAFGWLYGVERLKVDIKLMLNINLNIFWVVSIKYIMPVTCVIVFFISVIMNEEVTSNGYIFPRWAHILGWIIVIFVLLPIVIQLGYEIHRRGLHKDLYNLTQPVETWKPAFDDSDQANPLKMTESAVFELNVETDKYIPGPILNEAYEDDDDEDMLDRIETRI